VHRRNVRIVAAFTSILAWPTALAAGGFGLSEQNVVGLGTAYSSAAAAEDASTIHFNPAGLAWRGGPELVGAVHRVHFSARYTDRGSDTAGQLPLTGNDGGNGGGAVYIPNFYYAQRLGDSFAFGVGLSSPWGLKTEYRDGWVGRYHALKTELATINLNPSVAWRVTDELAVGFGLNVQRAEATFSNALDFGLAGFSLGVPGFVPGSADGRVVVQGDSTAYGYNVGFLYQPGASTRFGLHFRSKVSHDLKGDAQFSGVPAPFAPGFPDQAARARLTMPEIVAAHFLQDLAPGLTLTGDVSWFNFSRFDVLTIRLESPATPDLVQPQNWKDTFIYSLGLTWRPAPGWALRAGAAYDETPVRSAQLRTPRIPDANRRWLTAGVSWSDGERWTVHGGYAHLFFGSAPIENHDGQAHTLRGSVDLSAHILSVQGSFKF
jgi:long-chain fatty acid transport protein